MNLNNKGQWPNKHVNYLIIFLITLLVIFLGLQIHFYCKLSKSLSETNRQALEKMDSIVSMHANVEYKMKPKKWNESRFALDSADLENITSHIRLLIAENQKESYRAESIIDKDIDRLTLYMSITMAVMTLFGIFIPILVNIITTLDTRSDLETLKQKYEHSGVEVARLELQNSVFRLMNIGTLSLLEFTKDEQKAYMIKQFNTIIEGFDEHSNLVGFNSIVEDLEMVFDYVFVNIILRINKKAGENLAQRLSHAFNVYLRGDGKVKIKTITSQLEEFVIFLENNLPQNK